MGWMPAWFYDGIVGLFTFGQEQKRRQEILDLAQIQPGQKVLDVGCGTGTMAILAAEEVGSTGEVVGIDPSESLLARARTKAACQGPKANYRFEQGLAEDLSNHENIDVVLCTFCLHHLPGDELQQKALGEMKRALKPGGKLLVVDFPEGQHHHSHGCCNGHQEVNAEKDPIVVIIQAAGFTEVKAQPVRMIAVLARRS
jgi:demethylmenaquinone methyltransferase/2-methoxy-6-polyprenyl-1,4-benzoquinol methylase/phosphoethanolamine N-methyltransferase